MLPRTEGATRTARCKTLNDASELLEMNRSQKLREHRSSMVHILTNASQQRVVSAQIDHTPLASQLLVYRHLTELQHSLNRTAVADYP